MKKIAFVMVFAFLIFLVSTTVFAQKSDSDISDLAQRITNQEEQINDFSQQLSDLRNDLQTQISDIDTPIRNNAASAGMVAFLFGAFCALWAQNTGRSAWTWFFLGAFFNVLTVIVLLAKNSDDRASAKKT